MIDKIRGINHSYAKPRFLLSLLILLTGCITSPQVDRVAQSPAQPILTPPVDSVGQDTPSLSGQPITGPSYFLSSNAVAVSPDGEWVAAVNPDSGSITILTLDTLSLIAEVAVGDEPKTLAFSPDSLLLAIANFGSSEVSLINLASAEEILTFPVGAMPYGVVVGEGLIYVAEYALGNVGIYDLESGNLAERISTDPYPAGLALHSREGTLYITHLFSGHISKINLESYQIEGVTPTRFDTNLSQFIAISPDGTKAYLPQTRFNATNTARLFDTTVFPIVNVLDLATNELLHRKRITLDTADQPVNMPFAVALHPEEDILFLANTGSNDVSVIDLTTNQALAHIDVGSNPRGIAISPDGRSVFVNNVLDGTLSIIDTNALAVIDTIQITEIPLDPQVLLGKKLFNSAAAPVMSTDRWISCATCHFDGGMDQRTWLGFPDGPRNTPALFGVAETLPIHWSGDLDELQDVEITIREIQFGQGLVAGQAYDSLGPPHAGLSPELDALATYMNSIDPRPSPYVSDPETIQRGELAFNDLGCGECHRPPLYTDQQLHDVGTGNPVLEKNSHGRGTRFDTPSLRGLWLTPPYFHDGSASTLPDVLRMGSVHDVAGRLSPVQLSALVSFLLSLPTGE